jgi:hypothetical protein
MTCTIESRPISQGIGQPGSILTSRRKNAAISVPSDPVSPSIRRRAVFWSISRLYERAVERALHASGIHFEQ